MKLEEKRLYVPMGWPIWEHPQRDHFKDSHYYPPQVKVREKGELGAFITLAGGAAEYDEYGNLKAADKIVRVLVRTVTI